jgi:hypothetical protein
MMNKEEILMDLEVVAFDLVDLKHGIDNPIETVDEALVYLEKVIKAIKAD